MIVPASGPFGSTGATGRLVDIATGTDDEAGTAEMDDGSAGDTTGTTGGCIGKTKGTAKLAGRTASATDGTSGTAKTAGKCASDTGGTTCETETTEIANGNIGEAVGEIEAFRSAARTAEGIAGGNANCIDCDDMGTSGFLYWTILWLLHRIAHLPSSDPQYKPTLLLVVVHN